MTEPDAGARQRLVQPPPGIWAGGSHAFLPHPRAVPPFCVVCGENKGKLWHLTDYMSSVTQLQEKSDE